VTLRNGTLVTKNHADPNTASGGGIFVVGGAFPVTLQSGSSVTGNTPDNCVGTTC
jgi:hypothetical protein